ncbi:SWIM zinc finger domain-containing protein [Coraliomargarita sp. SDUM461003]|uniref:SWIM zinc finger domain-containing protein n=1 Tax=Thalassobacterium maritimum TaxID=3041265 RepID=A0ABU1AXM4_9BACT|nr:SWIM zinc finger family protein [Coraliomargarita sp. SDUM461003]MDQ8207875.1 SWIM zinc finger domain-containing protein [Coraliomargarita sp. SDUM461003]
MLFEFKYKGASRVRSNASSTSLSFVPDAGRAPTWFNGQVRQKLLFREAISALHDVVISDLRFKPKDREDYKRWASQQEDVWLAESLAGKEGRKEKIAELRAELDSVNKEKKAHMGAFYQARSEYYNYLYKHNKAWWFVLDPVITVHPDQVFFECFSEDESTYACLSCNHDVFETVDDFSCGTTNIDYSENLYGDFQKIRDYKETSLTIDPEGFNVQTGEDDAHREVKIDLPDSWVRGFLQVSSAMTLAASEFELHPMDLHNICFILKQKKEKSGPRSLRFILNPGQPIKIIVDPWNLEIKCPRSVYLGSSDEEIRIWGRRRLLTLERLIPHAVSIKVRLTGYGLPSFWMIDLGDITYTLGLSGWTANDWSRAGNFDLLAPRGATTPELTEKVLQGLRGDWRSCSSALAQKLQLPHEEVLGALSICAQAGRVVYDLKNEVWRSRELTREPLPLSELRYANERESRATELLKSASVQLRTEKRIGGTTLTGTIEDKNTYIVEAFVDLDERLVRAKCSCNFYQQNKLRSGPCEHILALRMAKSR